VPELTVPPGVEGIVTLTELPDDAWRERWERIVVPADVRQRLRNYMLFSLRHRARLSGVGVPLHGLIVLAGPPGTGKTTLAGGLADEAARALETRLLFVDVNPHAFPSQLLGESQRSVARLFERTIPDLARRGHPVVVLLDEVEALAVNRSGASLETNPVDVHRATDAVLSGLDHVSRTYPNVTFLATTNHAVGVDRAFLSRADLTEEIGYPDSDAVASILLDTIREITGGDGLEQGMLHEIAEACAAASVDARQVRKLVLHAVCSTPELALNPERLTVEDLARVAPHQPAGDGRTPSAT